jgi:hypothetical protein
MNPPEDHSVDQLVKSTDEEGKLTLTLRVNGQEHRVRADTQKRG